MALEAWKRMRETLRQQGSNVERYRIETIIKRWRAYYPRTLFKEPPAGKHGKTVDACSARAIREVISGILQDIRKATD